MSKSREEIINKEKDPWSSNYGGVQSNQEKT